MPVENGDPLIIQKSGDNGIMKVRVTGLSPDTHYNFQTITTSKTTSDIKYAPSLAPYPEVITESKCRRDIEVGADLLPFANDLIQVECFYPDQTTPAEGTILLAYTFGADHPISSFVGDGITLPGAYIDLNNLFSADSFENKFLPGNEALLLVQYMGAAGMRFHDYGLPCNEIMTKFRFPITKNDCKSDFNGTGDVDVEDLNAFAPVYGLIHEFYLYYAPVWGDLDGDGDVDGVDLANMGNDMERFDCPGCE